MDSTFNKRLSYRPDLVTIHQKEYVPMPDSLGGKMAIGNVILLLYLSKQGIILNYDVARIRVATDPCERVEYYGIGAPSLSEGKRCGTIVGQEVLDRFAKWIEESYQKLDIKINTKHKDFTTSDTVMTIYTFEVNPIIQNSIDSAIIDYTIPKFTLPESLGGKKVKGNFGVRILLDSTGKIICWFPIGIFISKQISKGEKTFESYLEVPPYKEYDQIIVKKFSPWINSCINKIRFDIDKRSWIWKEMEAIPLTIYIQINAKKVRYKGDNLDFLLNLN